VLKIKITSTCCANDIKLLRNQPALDMTFIVIDQRSLDSVTSCI